MKLCSLLKNIVIFSCIAHTLLFARVFAQFPSSDQIQQFQSLSQNQRQTLLDKFNIGLSSSIDISDAERISEVKTIEPRQPSISENQKQKKLDEYNKYQQKNNFTRPLELSRFGLSLFAGTPLTFTPLTNVPVPGDYVVGPGDEIVIHLYGKENKTHRLQIQRNGNINFPELGAINVLGMTFATMQDFLSKRIEEQMIGFRGSISLGELRSMEVFVLGDAFKPGAYSVNALTTISQAIHHSGGFAESGSLRDVQLRRNGKLIRKLDLYDLLINGNTHNDVRLQPGDTVFIGPVKNTIAIYGEVNRPAIYEIKPNENMKNILFMAGGLTSNALKEKVLIRRNGKNGLSYILDRNVLSSVGLNTTVINGDDIKVLKRGNVLQEYVYLEGDIVNPGFRQWKKNLRINDVLTSINTSVNKTADLNYALVVRQNKIKNKLEILQFSIKNALNKPNSIDNVVLQPQDRVLIFNRFSSYELERMNQKSETAKTFVEAEKQSNKEEVKTNLDLSDQMSLSRKQAALFVQENEINTDQFNLLLRSSRKNLLAPVLLQLQQQSSLTSPPAIVDIVGEVKNPGRYPITNRNKIADLVVAAGGLTADAYTIKAELARNLTNSKDQQMSVEIINISLKEALLGKKANNISLVSRDRINILQKPGSEQLSTTVVLQGEVRFPGTYPIKQGETLKDLLQRAGGLTKFANPKGAIFTREALRLQEQELLQSYVQDLRKETVKKIFNKSNSNSSILSNPDKTLSLIEEAAKTKALGRMVVQINEIMQGNISSDFMLEDGDFLFVPRFRNTVSIMGEVQVAVTYLLDEKLTAFDYVAKAGGLKKQADKNRIFVIRADGSVFKPTKNYWFKNKEQQLSAGDTIVVPIDTDFRENLDIIDSVTSALYQTGIAVNALRIR